LHGRALGRHGLFHDLLLLHLGCRHHDGVVLLGLDALLDDGGVVGETRAQRRRERRRRRER
jgi:hypothetical protein